MAENNEFSFENEAYRKTYWHTCSHVLAQAVKRLREGKLALAENADSRTLPGKAITTADIAAF